jgi:GDP-4-dehydro-6-deoxy-D-mannose reductase
VTGSRGFVGPYLVEELRRRGVEVVGIDRPERTAVRPDEPATLGVDLRRVEAVSRALAETRPDAVFHLAARSSAAESFSDPLGTLRENVDAAGGLLEAARQRDHPPLLLLVGSCEEYGPIRDPEALPVREEQPLHPASPYAVSKATQTLLGLQYHQAWKLPVICTRSFTHTGPGQSERFVFSSFARQIAEQERTAPSGRGVLEVGNLEAVRDVSDVRDVVRAYVELVERGRPGRIYNVCSGRGLRISEGLAALRRLSTLEVDVHTDPGRLRPTDVPVFVGHVGRLQETLGWVPDTPIERTLGDLLQYWRDRVGRSS